MINSPSHLISTFEGVDDRYDFATECHNLLQEVKAEFRHEKFGTRMHNSDATYMDGCTGPLCKMAHRNAGRKSTDAKPRPYWRIMEPVLEFMGDEVARILTEQIKLAKQRILEEFKDADIVVPYTSPDGSVKLISSSDTLDNKEYHGVQ